MRIALEDMDRKDLMTVSAFLALAMDGDYEKAGRKLNQHLLRGGSLDQ